MPDPRVLPQKATDFLKRDHKEVKDLFEDYEEIEEGSHEEKNRLFEEIQREISIHSQIEEKIFYPGLRPIPFRERHERRDPSVLHAKMADILSS